MNRSDAGSASIQFVVAAALSVVLVVGLVQVLVLHYARGAAMAAAERGVRAGSLIGGDAGRCLDVVRDSLADVLGGEIGSTLEAECVLEGDVVTARVSGALPPWMVGAPSLAFSAETTARREPVP